MDLVRDDPILFYEGDLSATLQAELERVRGTVDGIPQRELLGTTLDDLAEQVAQQHSVPALELHADAADATQEECMIPTDRLSDGRFRFGRRAGAVPGHMVSYNVPFSGDPSLFKLRPSSWTSDPPRGVVRGQELVFTYQVREVGAHVKHAYDRELDKVESYVRNQRPLVEQHNLSVMETTKRLLTERVKRIRKAEEDSAALGVPLRRRADAPTTYAAPEVRRRLRGSSSGHRRARPADSPEPTLKDAEYEHILKVMRNMALVLERSPSAFEATGEEGIRWHFLVQLNAQYEGQATGETFNFRGKTDILVRSGERNIFIAECKFWKGAKAFVATVDQLLGYLTWRDTKAAIVLFNRDVQFSTVLTAVPEALANHESCCSPVKVDNETTFSTVLRRRDDPERQIKLAVMVFDVPKRSTGQDVK